MLRLAGTLTAGTVRASEILRVTQGGGTPTLLGKALAEYDRIAKTEHLLDFIDVDEGYRRQIHTQLTLQESRHALARLIFHGRRGQIRQSYREGQEDQPGALGLVLNAVILWNTRYLDAALTELRGHGASVTDEDVQRLSRWSQNTSTCWAATPSPQTPRERSFGPFGTPTKTERPEPSNIALNVIRPVWRTRHGIVCPFAVRRLVVPTRIGYSPSETSSFAVFSIQSIASSERKNPSRTLSPTQEASAVGWPATAII